MRTKHSQKTFLTGSLLGVCFLVGAFLVSGCESQAPVEKSPAASAKKTLVVEGEAQNDKTEKLLTLFREKTKISTTKPDKVTFEWLFAREEEKVESATVQGKSVEIFSTGQEMGYIGRQIQQFFTNEGFEPDLINLKVDNIKGQTGYRRNHEICLVKIRTIKENDYKIINLECGNHF